MIDNITNEDRADLGETAIEAFANETGQDMSCEKQDVLVDLLADLIHWTDRNFGEVDFESAMISARAHYYEEVAD